ncbi:MAG: hypothetical protein U9N34_05555, partial [Candidatus Cloacimonadota bacterium]|nr:hypothetical protein [Candidatus Cloacimonadota bacterium]
MTKIYELVKELDFVRTAGSLEEDKAIKIITSHLDDIGLQYKLEPFEMVNYEPGLATIKCDDKKFDCYPFGLDSSQEISGELVFLENSQSLLFDNISYKGKIIISKTYSRKL